MFDKILETAHNTGTEIIVQVKDVCCDRYRGRVLELTEDYFSLFNSGTNGGVHWAFKRESIAFIGLVVKLPHSDELELTCNTSLPESFTGESAE